MLTVGGNKMDKLTHISKPIFLHYLSRGLQRSVFSYSESTLDRIIDDFRFTLSCSYEHLYISTAHLFENEFAFSLIQQFPKLFWYGHVQVSQKETSIEELILEKKHQYRHVKDDYSNYFNDRWKRIVDLDPNIKYTQGVSRNLQKELVKTLDIAPEFAPLQQDQNESEIAVLRPYLIHSVHERKQKALTNALFTPVFERFRVNPSLINRVDKLVNQDYLKVQIARDQGTIVTGVTSGVDYYSHLCPTFPYHHIPIWKNIYQILGLRQIIREFTDIEFHQLRESTIYMEFIDSIRVLIGSVNKNETGSLISNVKFIKYSIPERDRKNKGLDLFLEIIQDFGAKIKDQLILQVSSEYSDLIIAHSRVTRLHGENRLFKKGDHETAPPQHSSHNLIANRLKETLTNKITEGQHLEVIDELSSILVKASLHALHRQLMLSKSNYLKIETDFRIELMTREEHMVKTNKISKYLLELIDNLTVRGRSSASTEI